MMACRSTPSYLDLWQSGELQGRVARASAILKECRLCPRACGANRQAGESGFCRTGAQALVSSFCAHFGEEAPLVGSGGSGTIFFAYCNLGCVFCQNHDISQGGQGREVEPEELARMMLYLQECGCHNINFVSPTHVVPQILAGLLIAAQAGLRIPLVYNSGGYDSLEALHLLNGVIDIYMPDMKYADPVVAKRFSGVPDYPQRNQEAVREMHRQAGDLLLDSRGVARSGLLIRHLVLPNDQAGTEAIVHFLADEISCHTYLNVMDQYRPCYLAHEFEEIRRPISAKEYGAAWRAARDAGMCRLDDRLGRRLLRFSL